jgi:hypothetical protein
VRSPTFFENIRLGIMCWLMTKHSSLVRTSCFDELFNFFLRFIIYFSLKLIFLLKSFILCLFLCTVIIYARKILYRIDRSSRNVGILAGGSTSGRSTSTSGGSDVRQQRSGVDVYKTFQGHNLPMFVIS